MIRRLALILVVTILLGFGLWASWQRMREQYLIPWLGSYLADQVKARTGWRLNYRSLAGNLYSDLDLYAVRLEPSTVPAWFAGAPSDLGIEADHIHLSYTPWDLARRTINGLDVSHGRARLGPTTLNLTIGQVGELVAIACPRQSATFSDLRPYVKLPDRTDIQGQVDLEGEWLFKRYKPHLMQVRLNGRDVRVRWGVSLDARADLDLALSGPVAAPSLEGRIDVNKGRWTGIGSKPFGSAMGAGKPAIIQWANAFPGSIRVMLAGSNLWLQTEQLKARLRADMVFRKPRDEPARLVGELSAVDGIYNGRGRRFVLRSGVIAFHDRPDALPQLSATLETRVKRYRIQALVSGTLRDSHLQLISQPELSQEDILALMVFGRRTDRLNSEQRQQLAQENAGEQALDVLFLGRAELIAARWLGLDEINVTMAPRASSLGPETTGPTIPIESVEIGKYVIPDKLFGSYQLAPTQVPGEPMKHTLGAEYELTDSFSIGATVSAALRDQPAAAANQAGSTLDASAPSRRRLEAEEAFVRFRWKF